MSRYYRDPDWMRRHRELEAFRRLRENRRRKYRRKHGAVVRRRDIKWLPIPSPARLNFGDCYIPTVKFLNQIRRTSAGGGHPIFIVMRKCIELEPEVALVLAAEIERCQHHRPRSIDGSDPRDDDIAAMLRDIGFHKLLNFNEPRRDGLKSEATTYVQMKSGVQGGGQHVDALRKLVLGNAATASDSLRDEIIIGMNEAVLNVQQHAYLEGVKPEFEPMPNSRWWIAGYRDASRREIGFIAFDQGVGIPVTMPVRHAELVSDIMAQATQLLSWGNPTADHLLIKRAFELGRSRTGKTGQGKGLNDFKEFLAAAGGKATLRILSGRGSYIYNYDRSEIVEPLPLAFHGTLVVWRLTESPAVNWDGMA